MKNESKAVNDGPFADALRNWVPPTPEEWARFEQKAAALSGASNLAVLALVPAALAVFVPLLNLSAPWSTIAAGGFWTLTGGLFVVAAVGIFRAKRMQVRR